MKRKCSIPAAFVYLNLHNQKIFNHPIALGRVEQSIIYLFTNFQSEVICLDWAYSTLKFYLLFHISEQNIVVATVEMVPSNSSMVCRWIEC